MTFGKSGGKIKIMVKFNEDATRVARFYANSDYANLNCNRNSGNTNSTLEIALGHYNENTQQHIQEYLLN